MTSTIYIKVKLTWQCAYISVLKESFCIDSASHEYKKVNLTGCTRTSYLNTTLLRNIHKIIDLVDDVV